MQVRNWNRTFQLAPEQPRGGVLVALPSLITRLRHKLFYSCQTHGAQ